MKKFILFAALTCFLPATSLAVDAAVNIDNPQELRILRVTPEGADVPAANQIVIEFNRPVVPLGKMERSQDQIPITITPTVNCQWRWLNTATLACNLDEKNTLRPATTYRLTINPGIQAEDGATIAAVFRQSFITQRPDISRAEVRTWSAPGMPTIALTTTQIVTKASLQQHLVFISADGKSYPAEVERDNSQDSADAEDITESDESDIPPQQNDQQTEQKIDPNLAQAWLVTPSTELPSGTHVILHVTPGLVSTTGPEVSIADRDVLAFDTFPAFKFVGINCTTNQNKNITITVDKPQASEQLCNPLENISLMFTAPVSSSSVLDNLIVTPTIPHTVNADDTQQENEQSQVVDNYTKDQTYAVVLPPLKAAQSYQIALKPASSGFWAHIWQWFTGLFGVQPLTNIQDQFGRKLPLPAPITINTSHRPPNFAMLYANAVLEKATDSEVPVYVNNLKNITFNYRRVTPAGAAINQSFSQQIPNVADIQFAVPLGVREMLQHGSGAIYGKLLSLPTVSDKGSYERSLFAQVTPYQVQVKLGHFNTLVWVTDLATGQPVADAKLTVYRDTLANLSTPHDVLTTAMTDTQGTAILPGTQQLDPALQYQGKQTIWVRVDKNGDMALIPLNDDFSIDIWRITDTTAGYVYTYNRPIYGHMVAWGTTAQGIYRVGDTIQYKLYVRNQDNHTLVPAPAQGYTLQIVDPTDKVMDEIKDVHLSEFGGYSGEFTIPTSAPVGWYEFRLRADFTAKTTNQDVMTFVPIRVLVSDFTPAAFKVSSDLNGDLFKAGQTVDVATTARLHSGGAYTDASARVTAILNTKPFIPKHELTKNFKFDSYSGTRSSGQQIFQKIAPLDDKGELHTQFNLPVPEINSQSSLYVGQLSVESAVQDDRGKYIAAQSQADYAGVDRLVGLKATQWVYAAQQPALFDYIVVDEQGNPVKNVPVDIVIERQITSAARVKDAGNAYVTHYNTSWQSVANCRGTPAATPMACEFTPKDAGNYRVTASIKDTQQHVQTTQMTLWVTGKNYVLWDDKSDTYLPIVPEKSQYQVGDTARYLLKNPYPGATALITIERYGVLDRFVQKLDGSSPIITFPIKPDYLPGFYLSVLVVSPRVDKPIELHNAIERQVDLGKPTFRMGYIAVPVHDTYKQITVTAKTDRAVYRPRDTVTLQLHAQPEQPTDKPEPIEFTVTVLDEGVFDLLAQGREYFDPYQGFYHLDPLDMQNYSLLTRLIGRQKFEKKGANPGGDGGIDLGARNFFKFVSYWNPSIKADVNGNATISFQAPDNLTGWRVLAIAVTPNDRMGLGEADFKVNRPTEVRAVMPNQVGEGDSFKAGFSVMNRTEKTRTLQVTLQADGAIAADKLPITTTQTITLAPYKRTTVWLPITVNQLPQDAAISAGNINFVARAGDDIDNDAMEYTLTVHKLRVLETTAVYGSTTENTISQSLLFPQHIYSDIGGINVVVAPSVINNVAGSFKYLRDYPYDCWEQKLTKGTMAAHYQRLYHYLPDDFTWPGSVDLPQQTLNLAANYQAPNGGMTFYVAKDEYVDPYLSAYTALVFNWLRADGYQIPEQVEKKLHGYLLNILRHDAMPDYYSAGMSETVRAVALAALAGRGQIELQDLQRYLPHVRQMSLFGKAYFLQAASQVPGADDIVTQTTQAILAHADQSSGKFVFSESLDGDYQRILSSPLRDNCAILDSFTRLQSASSGKGLVGDIPFKLMSTIMQTRQNRDHWQNTQENIFCMQALVDYSRAYEQASPQMTVTASMNNQPFGQTNFNHVTDAPVVFSKPMQADDAGRKTALTLQRQGSGRLYYTMQLNYAPLANYSQPTNAGMDIQREYSVQRNGQWVLIKNPLQIQQGELVRVDIYLSLPAARNFVVVDDPVPGGLEPVNRDLATTSTVDAEQTKFTAAPGSIWFQLSDWIEYDASHWSFYHQELRNDAVRFYADYLPAGNYHLFYTAQAIASGSFMVMPVHAEEMYNPDVFSRGVAGQLKVEQ